MTLSPSRLKMDSDDCMYNLYILNEVGKSMGEINPARGKAIVDQAESMARIAQSRGVTMMGQ